MALLNEFARLYQLAAHGLSEEDMDEDFIMIDAENYILERLL